LKVLHINNFSKGGGAETVFNITRKIKRIEIKNYVGFTNTHKNEETPDINFFNWENDNKFLGTINYIFSLKNYTLLFKFLRTNKIDVIHIHGFFSSLSPSILLAIKRIKKNNDIKIIQTLHDFHLICPNSSLFNFGKNEICEKCIGKKYKWFIFKDKCDRRGFGYSIIKGIRSFASNNIINHKKVIDQFVVPSNFLRNKLLEDKVEENRINLIRNPLTLSADKTLNKKQNIICYFGRFSAEKNLKFLISAFSLWKEKNKNDFRLLLIGDGEKESELKNIANASNFVNDIIFKTFLPKEQLFDEIKNAKYFSLTSKCYENFPMSVIESIELDILPIVPNIGGMRESIQDVFNIGITYQANNLESWLTAVNNLESNYQKEINKLKNNKKRILSDLKSEIYKKKIVELYLQ